MSEETLFQEALSRSPAERAAFLDEACAARSELRVAVEALLAAHERPGNLLDRPARPLITGEYTPDPADASPPVVTIDYEQQIATGRVIAGRYTLVEKIGEGGMGEVWVAKQTEPVKRKVALKLIKAGMDSRAVVQRFEQERQALALMDHPNIAKVLDGGVVGHVFNVPGAAGHVKNVPHDACPFFVMELVNGLPLTKFCDQAKLGIRERLELFTAICQAVQHAHQKGIIHRDLKPSNILVTLIDSRPMPKVIDFGVAKAIGGKLLDESLSTQFGAVVGTLEYVSPEQAGFSGTDIDTRADIYSLGVILYELLTGLRPHDAKRLKKAALTEMIRIIQEEEPSKPSTRLSTDESLPSLAAARHIEPKRLMALLRGELDWVVMKCLEKQRERRYETANALARDIQRYLADEAVEARPPSTGYRLKKFVERHKGQVIAASLVLFVLLVGIVGTTWGLIVANQARADEAAQRVEAEKSAEAERLAKLDADAKRKEAETNLAYAKKGNEILGSVFAGLNPKANYATVAELRNALRDNLDKAVKELEGSAIGVPLEVAAMQNTLGEALWHLGEANAAVEVLQGACATRKARLGPDHRDTLDSVDNLANAYQAAGQLDKAVTLHGETLKRRTAQLGPDHAETIGSKHNLALAYLGAGQFDRALSLLEEVLQQWTTQSGPDHSETLIAMGNLAEAYRETGRRDKALKLLEKTRQLRTAKLGPDHPDTLASANNLATAYLDDGKVDEALPILEDTLRRRTNRLGPDHPDTLFSKNNLAMAYKDAGNLDRALPLLEETLHLRTAKLGPDHPDTLISMNNLAAFYWGTNRLDKSIPLFEDVLKLQERKLGRQHPDAVLAMANLGVNYKDAGRLAEAVPLLEEAYRESKKYPQLRSFVTNQLLDVYDKAGENVKLVTLLREQVAQGRKALPADSPVLATLLAQCGSALLEQKNWTEAEPLLRECLAIREKAQPDVWSTFNTQSMLGGALLGQKKYADAEPLLLAGYEGMKQREKTIPPQGQVRLLEAIERLVQLYEAMDKKDDAAKWRAELEAIKVAQPKPEKQP